MDSAKQIVDRIHTMQTSPMLVLEMQRISSDAANGSEEAVGALETLLKENHGSWTNGPLLSSLFHALSKSGTDRSMQAILDYVLSLRQDIPYGAVELISSLLSAYGHAVAESAFKLTAMPLNSQKAVGINTLCSLYLEGKLDEVDTVRLKGVLELCDPEEYLASHIVDLVLSEMKKEPADSLIKLLGDT